MGYKLLPPPVVGFDEAEVRKAVAVLADPEHAIAFRGLPSGQGSCAPGNDLDACVRAARSIADNRNLYYILNPVALGHVGNVNVTHILKRRWLLLDFDPVKEPSHKDDMASQEEKDAAMTLACEAQTWLTSRGWPDPIEIDSGNGAHLLYRIDLPNTPEMRDLVTAVLVSLKSRYDGPMGTLDRKVRDAPRISALPGAMKRKGDSSPERPYRFVKLLRIPDQLVIVERSQLEALVDELQPVTKESPPPVPTAYVYVPPLGITPYAAKALSDELSRIASAPEGSRNDTLNSAAYSLFTMAANATYGLSPELVEAECTSAGEGNGLTPAEVRATVGSARKAGMDSPRQDMPKAEGNKTPPQQDKLEDYADDCVTIPASEVTPKKVRWLWPGRIPLGKLTTFAGVGGLGKTFILCDITARITTGETWPDGSPNGQPGAVLFISGEDDPDDTLVPRMIALQADLTRVRFLNEKAIARFTLHHLGLLEKALYESTACVSLVVIDPPTAYLAGVDDHKNAELRQLLTPLQQFAARFDCSIVFNTHVNKGGAGKVEAMARVMGSVAWVNAVRSAYLFAKDPDAPDRRVFVPMKNNLGKERKGLAYQIESLADSDAASVKWHGEIDTTADQAISPGKAQKRSENAAEWMVELFGKKRAWPADELFKAAKAAGISRDAVFEAKRLLDVGRPRRVVLPNGDAYWEWWVPDNWGHLLQGDTPFT